MADLVIALVVLFAGPVLVVWWLPFLVHELGHALTARAAGAGFDYIPLGPFVMTRPNGAVRLQRQIRRFSCDSVLPSPARARAQLLATSLGGPAANVVLGVALLVVGFASGVGEVWFLAPLLLILVGLYMAMYGVALVLPWRPYGMPSDGLRVLSLLRNSRSAQRWMALRVVASRSEAGTRPRDWPDAELTSLVQPSDGSIDDVSGALTLYWHLLDGGRLTEARTCLEQARAAASQHYMLQTAGQLVLLELAYIEARIGSDPAVAVANLMRSLFIAPATLARVFAAVQLSYANFADAQRIAAGAGKDLRGLRPGAALMEKDLLAELTNEAQRRLDGYASASQTAAEGPTRGVDVSRFQVPDVPLREPREPGGLHSSRTVVGMISSAMLGLTAFVVVGAFDRALAAPVAVVAAALGAFAVLRVRMTRGAASVALARQGLAALATILVAAPLLLGDLLRPNATGYVWIAGQARPCAHFGTGHDPSSALLFLFFMAFAMLGLLIGTRADREPIIPRAGTYVGVGCLALWVLLVASDHARVAALLGCL